MFTLWLPVLLCTPTSAHPQGLWAPIQESGQCTVVRLKCSHSFQYGLHSSVMRVLGKVDTFMASSFSYRGFIREVSDQIAIF